MTDRIAISYRARFSRYHRNGSRPWSSAENNVYIRSRCPMYKLIRRMGSIVLRGTARKRLAVSVYTAARSGIDRDAPRFEIYDQNT